MFKWIKRLVDSYEKMLGETLPTKKPTVYKVGNKRYIRMQHPKVVKNLKPNNLLTRYFP